MLIVDGFFENGVFVPEKPLTAIKGKQRAVLNIETANETAEEERAKRQKAFQHFTQYRGALPANFDYKKELSEYRNERYGHIAYIQTGDRHQSVYSVTGTMRVSHAMTLQNL